MIPRHEVVEEGRGNAVLNRGPRQGELECQGSQRIQFGEPIVLKLCSTPPHSKLFQTKFEFSHTLAGVV